MLYILPISTAVLCIVSFLLMLRDMDNHRDLFQTETEIKDNARLLKPSVIVYSILMIGITVAASFLFCTIYKDNSILLSMKRLALLTLLWPIAYIDFKSYRIPNAFIGVGLVYRVILFPFELFLESDLVWMTLISEVIAALALLLAAFLCGVCIKDSIGFGDMKLFIIMGLMLSLDVIWSAIFLALIVSFFVSAYLLLTKKKTRKDVIPFGPAIVIGTYLTVCLSGM